MLFMCCFSRGFLVRIHGGGFGHSAGSFVQLSCVSGQNSICPRALMVEAGRCEIGLKALDAGLASVVPGLDRATCHHLDSAPG